MTNTSVMIATPAFGSLVTSQYVLSTMMLRVELARNKIDSQIFLLSGESLVQRARNICVATFMQSACTHLLFIDADIAYNAKMVKPMIDFDKEVVTAIYSKKTFMWDRFRSSSADPNNQEPLQQRALDFNINIVGSENVQQGKFVKVLDAATGFMLIQRACMERMIRAYPSLYCVNDIPGASKSGISDYIAIFDCMIDPENKRALSEDYSWCRRLQLLGGEVWADIASPLMHVGTYHFRPGDKELLRPLTDTSQRAT